MDWSLTIEKDGQITFKEGLLSDLQQPNPFLRMMQQIQHEQLESARVSATVNRSLQYGEIKVGFTISVNCPQDQRWMDYAAEHLFITAAKYVNDGMETIAPGIPPLHVPQPKST